MKKRDNNSDSLAIGPPISSNKVQDANLLDVLRGENLQLLEEKLTNEQRMNKLELELTLMKEHQTKTEDYESIQNELMEMKGDNKAMGEMITS